MNWEAIGAIAEALGAMGVLVTLIYLVGQVRTNNRLLRAETERSAAEMTNEIALRIADSRDLSEVFGKGLADPETLDHTDRGRFTWLLASLINAEQAIYVRWELGLATHEEVGNTQQAYRNILQTPGGRWWWQRNRNAYRKTLADYLDREIFSGS